MGVHAGRVLSDPLKIGRLWYTISPFLPENILELLEENCLKIHRARKHLGMLKHAIQLLGEHPMITNGVKVYRNFHEDVVAEFRRAEQEEEKNRELQSLLKRRYILFTTAVSIDNSDSEPTLLGYDFFNNRSRLADLLLNELEKIVLDVDLNDFALVPVCPVFTMLSYEQTGPKFEHVFRDKINDISRFRELMDRCGLGDVERFPNEKLEKQGFSQLHLKLYDTKLAQKYAEYPKDKDPELHKKLIKDSVDFNRHFTAMMFAYFIAKLDFPVEVDKEGKPILDSDGKPLKLIDVYAGENSYAQKIIQHACTYARKFYDVRAAVTVWPIYQEGSQPMMRECESVAIRRFATRVRNKLRGKFPVRSLEHLE
ncbi:hypothetical protein KY325_04220 [Candidatus Woesearchaeota archaeon]|nr:hypothetical protein [Candidatus Woesearchaeota archaeon]MBW3018341.1 hypothetical protein [Candidatus Woesearchaeota archaeon]